ncbi:helix-turn-helix transcriptional regulator [Umezawaea sp. Da 62-37]|uniref:helix-turn-helix domain-containing protein n=1 Tax=Umezawaea sp. Da 62-37 TaxID=3075927 RepID=UPI0028F6EA80|nr:helix-turn-helix transcriptional regulator [Umezawaea sp. Da 62-37]WNV83713.1 helix-turn-helix transcriptional regulator [Umezawaea sp. Da 62-37]
MSPDAARARGNASPRAKTADRRGLVIGAERDALRASFGALLRQERRAAGLSQAQLAERAGSTSFGISRLENGHVRPSTSMTWRLARALRGHLGEREAVALDLRLKLAAGSSLRCFSERTHRRRERIAAEVLAGVEPSLAGADPFSTYVLDLLADGS